MIPWQKISEFDFNRSTESLAGRLQIPNDALLPLGIAVENRYDSISVLYIPDDSRGLDSEWIGSLEVQSPEDILTICNRAFEKLYEVAAEMKNEFEMLLVKNEPYTEKQRELYKSHGVVAFFEVGSIVYVRAEDALIIGGSLEDYGHLAEHGVDVLYRNGEVEFGEGCEFDYLFESAPYE